LTSPSNINAEKLCLFNVERSPRYRLAALSRLWTISTEKMYEERFGLTLSQWRILAIVGAEQPIYASAIADRGLLEKPHISRLVGSLTGRGLLMSVLDKDDARRSWLVLTRGGRDIFEAVAQLSLEQDRRFMAALNARERQSLDGLLDKLLGQAPDRHKADAAPGRRCGK
jgi:DNA-binding MarR family transcriptional regulator